MFSLPTRVLGLCALVASVTQAHTLVRAVWVNGIDQGTGVGIRHPGFTGPPGPDWWGYDGNPVRNLTSIDMRCNRLGEFPEKDTIKVQPGDIVSFEWGHESRLPDDDVIASSHHGPVLVYIAPNPPVGEPWVKIFEEGEYEKNKWAVTDKLIVNKGIHSVQIPTGLKPGQYLLRPELITLHEAESIYSENPNRGAQLYMACVQIEVLGHGTVELPTGADFPGGYDYHDPGINYNIYWTPEGAPPYAIPGPTLWSGAAAPVPNPSLGEKKGILTGTGWTQWLITDPLPSMYYTLYTGADSTRTTLSSIYTAAWPTPTSEVPEPTSETTTTKSITPTLTPVETSTPVEAPTTPAPTPTKPTCSNKGPRKGAQCGGKFYNGQTVCRHCMECVKVNRFYSYCH